VLAYYFLIVSQQLNRIIISGDKCTETKGDRDTETKGDRYGMLRFSVLRLLFRFRFRFRFRFSLGVKMYL
jgi:hypothetical protein